MTISLAERLDRELRRLDPCLTGDITVTREASGRVRVFGRVAATVSPTEGLIRMALTNCGEDGASALLLVDGGQLRVLAAEQDGSVSLGREVTERPHRWLGLIYQGLLPISEIQASRRMKRPNSAGDRVMNCLIELGFVAPLVLDSTLRIIDGDLRLDLAKALEMPEVPVIIIDADERQAALLRLVLNRSSEFQRWLYPEVDQFVDSCPQLQPLLEPLGFFGERLLPTSYFADSITGYRLDGSEKQAQYRQEEGLAQWAEVQRRRILEAEQARDERPRLPSHLAPKLFDLPTPTEKDFLPTHDPYEAMETFVRGVKETGRTVTAAARARKAGRS